VVLGKGAAAACGALDAGSDAAHGRMSVADGETERAEVTRRLALTQLLWAESERGWWSRCEPAPKASLKPQTSTGKGPQVDGNVASLHHTVGSDNGRATDLPRQ